MSEPQLELRVYADFSEIRSLVETNRPAIELTFPEGVWEYVVPDSLGLLNLPYHSVTHAEAPSWLTDMEGQRVMVRLDPLAPLQSAVLMRASDLLVQDGSGYYHVREDQLVFQELPRQKTHHATRHITFRLTEPGKGHLMYLTRGLSWKPRYTLEAQQDNPSATLTALADVTNVTEGLYAPDTLELIAGDVQIKLRDSLEEQSIYLLAAAGSSARLGSAEPELEELPEVAGLYRYNVLNPPPLEAKSTVSVAFLPDAEMQLEREARLETDFVHVGAQHGNFNRGYTLTATQNLPGGRMTVREDGRIVGQYALAETAAENPIRFTLGRDPDITYRRTLRQVGVERNPEGKGKVRRVSYEVTFTVKNSKKRRVEATIRERHYDRVVMIKGADRDMDNIATLTAQIEAGESADLSYTVTVDR